MNLFGSYDFFLKIDNREIDIDPSYVSLNVEHSIWELLPKALLVINDTSSFLQEFFLTTPGLPIEITMGEDSIKNKFCFNINYDLIDDIENDLVVGGQVELPLIHRMLYEQKPISLAYEDRISGIIRKIAGLYKFEDVIVNDTGNDNIWYQPLLTDIEFIEKILLPYSLSRNAKDTPFFCFIDNNNVFQYRNYNALINEKSIYTLEYKPQLSSNKAETNKDENTFKITDIARRRKSYTENKKLLKRSNYYISREDGELQEVQDTIDIYSNTPNIHLPLVSEKEPFSWVFHKRDEEDDSFFGELINSSREGVSQDKFICVMPYNPKLKIGMPVNLKIYYQSPNDETPLSLSQFSGKYLIEKSKTILDGSQGQVVSVLTLGRKGKTFSNNYVLKDKLVK